MIYEDTAEVDVELAGGVIERRPATLVYAHRLDGSQHLIQAEPLSNPDTEIVVHRLGHPPLIVRTQIRK